MRPPSILIKRRAHKVSVGEQPSEKDNLQDLEVDGSKSSTITGLERTRGFQEVKVPRFRGNGTGWW